MKNNIDLLKKIDAIQYAIDSYIERNSVTFKSQADIELLERIYNQITGRRYTKFSAGCSSCISEALIIVNNYRKREQKEAIDTPQEPLIGSVEYNAKDVNNVNPFNPIGHDDEPHQEVTKKGGRRGK